MRRGWRTWCEEGGGRARKVRMLEDEGWRCTRRADDMRGGGDGRWQERDTVDAQKQDEGLGRTSCTCDGGSSEVVH